jgi:uncharacterized membrane protein
MARYLVQVIENVSVTAILAGLLWALVSGGGAEVRRRVLIGGAAGILLALVLAFLRRTTAINRAFVNVWTSAAIIVAGVLFIVLLWRRLTSAAEKNGQGAVFGAAAAVLAGLLLFYGLPTIFLYPTEFTLAGESVFSTDALFKLIGYLAGIAVAALGAAALCRTARRLPPVLPASVFSLIAAANCFVHAVAVVQFLFARRLIPTHRLVFRLVVAVTNSGSIFLYSYIGLCLLLPLVLLAGSRKPLPPAANPAIARKLKAALRSARRWCFTAVAAFALSVVCVTVVKANLERGVVLSPAEPMTIAGEEILIPIERVADGHLHRFAFGASDGTEVRFIVIRKNEAAYGVGLDACDICGATGYYERKGQVICRLCDVVMNISTIGFKGGCNPVPLAYALRGGNMVVLTGDLEAEKGRFK